MKPNQIAHKRRTIELAVGIKVENNEEWLRCDQTLQIGFLILRACKKCKIAKPTINWSFLPFFSYILFLLDVCIHFNTFYLIANVLSVWSAVSKSSVCSENLHINNHQIVNCSLTHFLDGKRCVYIVLKVNYL